MLYPFPLHDLLLHISEVLSCIKTFKNFMYLDILKGTGPKQLIAGDTFDF
jgi:hypothetical protein